jgi:RHH-type transcriptional regulator, rel operon repressor / antitoxin RelB
MTKSETVTIRLTPAVKDKLEALATSTNCSKSWLAAQAITEYVEVQSWQIEQIEQALAIADNAQAVDSWLDSWGKEDEQPTRCA